MNISLEQFAIFCLVFFVHRVIQAIQVITGEGNMHLSPLLQVNSDDPGVLIPRMTSDEIAPIAPQIKYKRTETTSVCARGGWITSATRLSIAQSIEANVYMDYLIDSTKISPSYKYVTGLEFDNWIKTLVK